MATVIFDFDSTLVTYESLEEVLKTKNLDLPTIQRIEEITAQGMSGKISFLDSLEKRLSIAPVNKQDFIDLGKKAENFITPGIKELIGELQKRSVDIWIVSGVVKEAMLSVCEKLGIFENQILGIDLQWDKKGNYLGIDKTKPINRSKWEGAKQVAKHWSSPSIAVGDGITDYALFEHGLVDQFIAFTGNVSRKAVIEKGVPVAKNSNELKQYILQYIKV